MDMERRDIRSKECMFAVHRGSINGAHISAIGIYYRGMVYDSVNVMGRVEPSTGMIVQTYYDPHKGITTYGLFHDDTIIHIGYIDGVWAGIIEDPKAFLQTIDYLTVPNLYGKPREMVITFGDLWGTSDDHWSFAPTTEGMIVSLNGTYQGTYTREEVQTLIYKKYNPFKML